MRASCLASSSSASCTRRISLSPAASPAARSAAVERHMRDIAAAAPLRDCVAHEVDDHRAHDVAGVAHEVPSVARCSAGHRWPDAGKTRAPARSYREGCCGRSLQAGPCQPAQLAVGRIEDRAQRRRIARLCALDLISQRIGIAHGGAIVRPSPPSLPKVVPKWYDEGGFPRQPAVQSQSLCRYRIVLAPFCRARMPST